MVSLEDIFTFTEMLHEFQQIRRQVLVNGEDRQENDWEHSFQTAMLAWYIINASDGDLDLDTGKVLKFALAHDLVEVYAGDTPFQEAGEDKEKREAKAAQRLQNEFPEFAALHSVIEAYEKNEQDEAQFVYALDKIIPLINIYMDGGRSWRKDGVTLEILQKHKKDKFNNSPQIEAYYEQLIELFTDEEQGLF